MRTHKFEKHCLGTKIASRPQFYFFCASPPEPNHQAPSHFWHYPLPPIMVKPHDWTTGSLPISEPTPVAQVLPATAHCPFSQLPPAHRPDLNKAALIPKDLFSKLSPYNRLKCLFKCCLCGPGALKVQKVFLKAKIKSSSLSANTHSCNCCQ